MFSVWKQDFSQVLGSIKLNLTEAMAHIYMGLISHAHLRKRERGLQKEAGWFSHILTDQKEIRWEFFKIQPFSLSQDPRSQTKTLILKWELVDTLPTDVWRLAQAASFPRSPAPFDRVCSVAPQK